MWLGLWISWRFIYSNAVAAVSLDSLRMQLILVRKQIGGEIKQELSIICRKYFNI